MNKPNISNRLIWLAVEQAKSEQTTQPPKKDTPKPVKKEGGSLIDQFNADTDLPTYLMELGFAKEGAKFRHPDSNSKAGISVTVQDGKQVSYSHHSKDPLADGHAHDAFDYLVQYEHGGDRNKALTALAERYPDIAANRDAELLDMFDDELTDEPPKKRLLVALRDMECRPPEYLIDRTIEVNSLVTLIGPSGSGKTFVALDWACSVASGSPWINQATKKGPVVYVLGEGQAGFKRRSQAWEQARQHVLPDDFYVTLKPLLLASDDHGELVALIAEMKSLPVAPVLVVIDTLARNFGGDENSTKDMSQFVNRLDQIRTAFGCTVLVVHHTGKAGGSEGRGSSALKAAVDSEFQIPRKGMLVSSKQKEMATDTWGFKFQIDPVTVTTQQGPVESAVVRFENLIESFAEPSCRTSELSEHTQTALHALQAVENSEFDEIPLVEARTAVIAAFLSVDPGVPEKTLAKRWERARTELSQNGFIQISQTGVMVMLVGGDQ